MTSDHDSGIAISVSCYSGYKADERPVSFSFNGTVHTVVDILDRWYGPDYAYFKLTAGDGNTYILRHNERSGKWLLHCFKTPEAHRVP